jgi:hypothetical protein
MQTNFKLIESKINGLNSKHKFFNTAKKLRIEYYSDIQDRLENLPLDRIEGFNFNIEVLNLAFELEKLDFIEKKLWKLIGIERHAYAPELNKILINGLEINAPKVDNMEKAVKFLCEHWSLERLKQLKKLKAN